jgi:hypothetical protein
MMGIFACTVDLDFGGREAFYCVGPIYILSMLTGIGGMG